MRLTYIYNRNRILAEKLDAPAVSVGDIVQIDGLNYQVKFTRNIGPEEAYVFVSPDVRVWQVRLNSALSERLDELLDEYNFVYSADRSRKSLKSYLEALILAEHIALDDEGTVAVYFQQPNKP